MEKKWVYALMLALAVGNASAAPLDSFFSNVINIINSDIAMYGITFILYLVLLYGIYSSAMKKIAIFQAGVYSGINKQGKIVSLCLAFLSVFSMFYFGYNKSIRLLLTDLLGPWGIFAGVALALVVFLMIFLGFKDADVIDKNKWQFALALIGACMILAGHLTTNPNIQHWGWLIAFIGAIILAISMLSKAGSGKGEKGDKGDRGDKGDKGGDGDKGDTGPKGDKPEPAAPDKKEDDKKKKKGDWKPVIEGIDPAARKLKGRVEEI